MNPVTPTDAIGKIEDELGALVHRNFQIAKQARQQMVDTELLACLRQRKGEYSTDELAGMGSIKTFVNITSTKCRAGEAWLDDIWTSLRDRPWTIAPTPIPSAPDSAKEWVKTKIAEELAKMGTDPVQVEDYIRDRAEDLKKLTEGLAEQRAQEAADLMALKIEDQLQEGGLTEALSSMRSDLMTFPYAVLKGPVVRRKKRLSWVGAAKSPEVKAESIMMVERVSPFDFYWAPWVTNTNDGYVIELMRMEQSALHACIEVDNFDGEKIKVVLDEYKTGHTVDEAYRSQREALEQNTNSLNNSDTIDVLDYWGSVRGSTLIEWGMTGIDDEYAFYEVNAWVVGDICIRALLNPDPLGKRPYYVTSFEKVPGSIIGRSPPMLMRPHQEIINSAYRGLRRNMGLASGPFTEVDQTRLADGQAPDEIAPGMVKLVEPDLSGSGQPVYRFHKIDSHASELLAVINNEVRACDDATGIPAYSYGNAAASGAGRTVGGLAMLMGNAAKGIKKVVGHMERDVLAPLVTALYNYNMLFDPDEAIKVDAQISAHGPTGIIMREAAVQRRMEALQLLTPYAANGIIPKDGLSVLLREVLKGLDLPVDDIIPDPKKQSELDEAAQATQMQGGEPQGQGVDIKGTGNQALPFTPEMLNGTPPPGGQGQMAMQPGKIGQGTTPTAVLDGRTGATQAALANIQNV